MVVRVGGDGCSRSLELIIVSGGRMWPELGVGDGHQNWMLVEVAEVNCWSSNRASVVMRVECTGRNGIKISVTYKIGPQNIDLSSYLNL